MATCWRPGSQKKQEEREEVGEPALDMGFFDLINKVVSYCCIHLLRQSSLLLTA